ncbi:MAG TPA: hypothetical protein VET23_01360 [Chitinophagaceae bacterium]|nr:hypothetical protein [Chitinophagaceae bacterium]
MSIGITHNIGNIRRSLRLLKKTVVYQLEFFAAKTQRHKDTKKNDPYRQAGI